MIIITCFDSQYYLSGRQLLNNLQLYLRPEDKIIVCDIGLTAGEWKFLEDRKYKQTEFVRIDFSKLEWWQKDKQSYFFKSHIWNTIVLKRNIKDIVLLLDSACLVYNGLNQIENLIKQTKIYSPYSAEDIKTYCHKECIKNMNFPFTHNLPMLSGGVLGIDLNTDEGYRFIVDFVMACSIPQVLIPEGSNKSNHRQDQSVLTLLYYLYKYKYNLVQVLDKINIEVQVGIFAVEKFL